MRAGGRLCFRAILQRILLQHDKQLSNLLFFGTILERIGLRDVGDANEHSYRHRQLFNRAYRASGQRLPLDGERLVRQQYDNICALRLPDSEELHDGIYFRLFGNIIYADANLLRLGPILERLVVRIVHFVERGLPRVCGRGCVPERRMHLVQPL